MTKDISATPYGTAPIDAVASFNRMEAAADRYPLLVTNPETVYAAMFETVIEHDRKLKEQDESC